MLISYKHRFIFIHNYKVAGTSITRALKKYGLEDPYFSNVQVNSFIENKALLKYLNNNGYIRKGLDLLHIKKLGKFKKHLDTTEIKTIVSDHIFDTYYKFGFVRNPWDWQVSLYNYMLQSPEHFQHQLIKNMESFEEYIEWRVAGEADNYLQKDFFYDHMGNKQVDFIGKLENIEEDFQHICDQVSIGAELPHANKSKRLKNYRKYYNDYTRELIEKNFKEDIELFDYEF